MGNVLDYLDSVFLSLENSLNSAWNSLVLEEQKHPIILALALIIVVSVLLTLICNCCCWCCRLCTPRQRNSGLIYVPAYYNYGTMMPPPLQDQQKHPLPPNQQLPPPNQHLTEPNPQPTIVKQDTTALVHV